MSDFKCPKCSVTDEDGWFNVSGRATFVVDGDGSVQDCHNAEWNDDSPMWCGLCNHGGVVADFTSTEEVAR